MNRNNTQIGHISSEPLLEHNDDQSNVDQILSNEIVITSQPLIPFTTTNMIPSQRFRIRERRQEAQERQQQETQRPRQQQLEQQQRQPRYRRWSEIERENEYWQSVGFEYYIEENMSPLLEAYEWGKWIQKKDRTDGNKKL